MLSLLEVYNKAKRFIR